MKLVSAASIIALFTGCDRPAPAPRAALGCQFSDADLAAAKAVASDTVKRLKSRAQVVTEVMPVKGGISVRTEDADSTAFHNGGAVSVDCAKHVTSVWLDGG
jgi:hypothetical protein